MKCEWWTRRSVCEEVSAEWNDRWTRTGPWFEFYSMRFIEDFELVSDILFMIF